jgi:soluble lytic murein transglycosylase-like protein
MFRSACLALVAACWCTCASAAGHHPAQRPHPKAIDDLIAHYAHVHGVPERLVRRVVQRESGFNPHLVHRHFYGLMQITPQSARTMGYKGPARGLLDPQVNLAYGVPYLANAYKISGGNENRAVRLYASGYYYAAKRKHLLGSLRTADSPSLELPPPPPPAPVAAPPPPNPVQQLLRVLTAPIAAPARQ